MNRVQEWQHKKETSVKEKKCELSRRELDFFGLKCSSKGISMQKSKFEALKNASAPKTPGEVRSLLGLANYCARFIPNLASVTKPLRELTKKNARWSWTNEQEQAFIQLKDSITTTTAAYFNKEYMTEVTVDASPVGLGLVMAQYDPKAPNDKHIVIYASRTLTDVESRYSQVEKEALGVVWACEKLHLYLYGREFEIITDNKAIELIYGNPRSKPKARIERWCLRLLPYKFLIKHRPGDGNIADYFSRNPIDLESQPVHEEIAERYVNFVATSKIPRALDKAELIEATQNDSELDQIKNMLRNKPYQIINSNYERLKHELSITQDGILMRGNNIVIPKELQKRVIEIAHTGHQGIVRTKQLLRNHVWFRGIDEAVERCINNCTKCQANTDKQKLEPLQMRKIPDEPWDSVCVDFYGPLKNGKYLFVLIDEHSRYPIVRQVSSTAFKAIQPTLDDIFATFGIPAELRSDNGPPFNSYNFKSYASANGFKHKRITPLWPRANGLCERFMRNLGKVMKNAAVDGSKWEDELLDFLRSYRATPHASTKVSPNELLFKTRRTTTKMPVNRNETSDETSKQAKINDSIAKAKMKSYGDRRLNTKPSCLKVGDLVLLKRQTISKAETVYDPKPFLIESIKGTQAIITREDKKRFRRNLSVLKKFNQESDPKKRVSKPSKSTSILPSILVPISSNARACDAGQTDPKSLNIQNSNAEANQKSESGKEDEDDELINKTFLDSSDKPKSPIISRSKSPKDDDPGIIACSPSDKSSHIIRTNLFDDKKEEDSGDNGDNGEDSESAGKARASKRVVKKPQAYGNPVPSDQRKKHEYKEAREANSL
jgi:hypothetical protein